MTAERFLYKDLKVRPFISTLAIKYIAVVIFCLYQLSMCLRLELAMNQIDDFKTEQAILECFLKIFTHIGELSLSLVLVWIVSHINGFEDRALRMLLFYGTIGILFYVGEVLSIHYYFIPKVNQIANTYIGFELDYEMLSEIAGYFSNFNVFLDMFLCTCIYYFSIAKPKRIKTKRGMIFFRLCVIFPIAYIIASFTMSGLLTQAQVEFSNNYFIGCLIPNKKPVLFIMFSLVVLFVTLREKVYNRIHRNMSADDSNENILTYEEYKMTNRYVINYSVIVSLILCVCAVADTLIGLAPGAGDFGFGKSLSLMLAIPFILLHDFTKKPLKKTSFIYTGLIYGVTGVILVVLYLSLAAEVVNQIKMLFS